MPGWGGQAGRPARIFSSGAWLGLRPADPLSWPGPLEKAAFTWLTGLTDMCIVHIKVFRWRDEGVWHDLYDGTWTCWPTCVYLTVVVWAGRSPIVLPGPSWPSVATNSCLCGWGGSGQPQLLGVLTWPLMTWTWRPCWDMFVSLYFHAGL